MRDLGWVPFDKENESVSKTLEYAYDDYCVARMAKVPRQDGRLRILHETGGGAIQNIFDPFFNLMRGKDSQGGGVRRSIRTAISRGAISRKGRAGSIRGTFRTTFRD